jgi:uncharacterized protein (TIGR02001 family)
MLSSAAAAAAGLKQAGEPPKPPAHVHVSTQLTLVSDYRRNGVTQSKNAPALQGRIDIRNGAWSAGAFATSMEARHGSNAHLALFGARHFEIDDDTDLSVGAAALFFFGGDGDPFGVVQTSVSHPLGPIDATLSLNDAPAQEAIHDEDGININVRARTPLGRLNGAPVTASASAGYSEGEFAMGAGTKLDWSVGLTVELEEAEIGLSYVDNNLDDDRGDGGVVFSISHDF